MHLDGLRRRQKQVKFRYSYCQNKQFNPKIGMGQKKTKLVCKADIVRDAKKYLC